MIDDEIDAMSASDGGRQGVLRVIGQAPDWYEGLAKTLRGKIRPTTSNAATIFQRDESWEGLKYDEFRGEPTCSGFPEIIGFDDPKPGPLDDYILTHMSHWLSLNWHIDLADSKIGTAALVASKAKGRAFHPVREYLRGLTWDGMPRIDQWLSMYAGVEGSEYTSAVGRMWLIAAVARVMQPGTICKTMIILEGKQDAGKSTLLRKLCPVIDWFSDTPIELGGGKDQFQSLRGKWIVEIPELDGFKGAAANKIKSFISSPIDNYRKSYGRTNDDVPRQCVFAGTTNEDQYLQDGTGNVRFWPVRVGGGVDFQAIERDRDQIWAEAFAEYNEGKVWHISDKRLSMLAKGETEEREEEDVWIAALKTWMESPLGENRCSSGVSVLDVLINAMEVPKKDQNKSHQTRAINLMRKMGFVQVPGSKKPRLYRRTEEKRDE